MSTIKNGREAVRSSDESPASLPWRETTETLHWESGVIPTRRPYRLWRCEHTHRHAYAEIVVCLQGDHIYGIDGRTLSLGPGSVALFPPHVPHDAWYGPHHRACIDFWLHFLPGGHVTMNTVHHEPIGGPRITSVACPDPSLLGDLKRACLLINQTPPGQGPMAEKAACFLLYLLYAMFEKFAEGANVRASTDESSIIETIKEYAGNHLADRLTLDELARLAGFSPFHFHRIFSRAEGMTPRDFIETKRIQRACRLLGEGQSITSAALDSGFMTCSQFDRVFKKHLKVSPSAWLKQKRES